MGRAKNKRISRQAQKNQKQQEKDLNRLKTQTSTSDLGLCPLCQRPMQAGPSVDQHHWIPKSCGGHHQSFVHRSCHKMIHHCFDEKTLTTHYSTAEALRSHPDIAHFCRWISKKPFDYVGRSHKKNHKIIHKKR